MGFQHLVKILLGIIKSLSLLWRKINIVEHKLTYTRMHHSNYNTETVGWTQNRPTHIEKANVASF